MTGRSRFTARVTIAVLLGAGSSSAAAGSAWQPLALSTDASWDAAIASHAVAARIFNGTPTSDFPAVVGVGIQLSDVEFGLCTGMLIAPAVVLTAAHCVDRQPQRVVVGVVRNGAQENHPVGALAIHPRHLGVNADVALLMLTTPVDGVTPLSLARTKPRPGRTGTIVGFGQDGQGQVGHREVGTVRLGRCPRGLRRVGFLRIASLVCWRADRGGSNTCEGDSGGPLLVNGAVAGVTLGGTTTVCGPSALSVDTSVAAFRSWIRQQLK